MAGHLGSRSPLREAQVIGPPPVYRSWPGRGKRCARLPNNS